MASTHRKLATKLLQAHGLADFEVVEVSQSEHWETGDVVSQALGEIADRLPRLVQYLRSADHVCAVHHESNHCGPWFLLYLIGDEIFMAGPPNDNMRDAAGWKVPKALQELYAKHDGLGSQCFDFGWIGFDPGVMPASRLSVPEVPQSEDLLRFTRGWGEAGEGGWCFVGKRKLEIVDVEDRHGIRSQAVPFDFWGFLDRYLTREENELPEAERF